MQRSSTLASDAFVRRSQSFQGSNLGASVRKVVRRPTVVGKGLDAQEMLCRLDEKCSDGRSCACSTSAPPTGVDGEVGAGGRRVWGLGGRRWSNMWAAESGCVLMESHW